MKLPTLICLWGLWGIFPSNTGLIVDRMTPYKCKADTKISCTSESAAVSMLHGSAPLEMCCLDQHVKEMLVDVTKVRGSFVADFFCPSSRFI